MLPPVPSRQTPGAGRGAAADAAKDAAQDTDSAGAGAGAGGAGRGHRRSVDASCSVGHAATTAGRSRTASGHGAAVFSRPPRARSPHTTATGERRPLTQRKTRERDYADGLHSQHRVVRLKISGCALPTGPPDDPHSSVRSTLTAPLLNYRRSTTRGRLRRAMVALRSTERLSPRRPH